MSWVNLNDVYVNKTGDTIAGDLSVGGALTVNDGKGTGTTYNVANEITTLRDSVSPKLLAETQSTSYTSFAVDLSTAKMLILMCCTKENRPLASTALLTYEFMNICKSNETSAQCCFGAEPANYTCNAYYANGSVYLKTQSSWDKVKLFRL